MRATAFDFLPQKPHSKKWAIATQVVVQKEMRPNKAIPERTAS